MCVWHAVDKAQVGQRQEHAAEHTEVHAESACANSMRQEHAVDRMQAFSTTPGASEPALGSESVLVCVLHTVTFTV